MKITVIIPAYNEGAAISGVLADIKRQVAVEELELLLVDDGSSDNTAEKARESGAKIITNPINMGYGFSLRRGIENASHEFIVTIDADGTYPAQRIIELVSELEHGYDMVVGARQGKMYWSSPTKAVSRLVFKMLAEFVAGKKIPDINSGFRAIRKSKIYPILPDLSKGFSFSTSSTLIFMLKGYFIKYIPVEYYKRTGDTKVRHFHDALKALQIMVDVIVTYNPIKLFLLVSILPSILFLVFVGLLLFTSEGKSYVIPSVLSLFTSCLIISLGFFADIFRKKE